MAQRQDKSKKSHDADERMAENHQPESTLAGHPLLRLQRAAGNRAVVGLLESRGWVQTKPRSDAPGNEFNETGSADEHQLQLLPAPPGIVQRKCATCTPASKCAECEEEEVKLHRKAKGSSGPAVQLKSNSTGTLVQRAPRNGDSTAPTAPDTETAPEPAPATAGPLIVDDEAATVAPGQMRKSEFLEQLRSTVCATADEALAEAGQSTEGCPYIEQWLSYYEDREPAHIERALRKYAPEAATATSAHDYVPAVSNRVRRGIETWAKTGEITGVPDELKDMLTGPGAALGAIGGMLGSIGSAIGGAVSAVAGAIGGAFSSIGKALFKQKEGQAKGGAGVSNDPSEIQQQLRGGQPLDSAARSRMSEAFGHDFSGVRVHTNSEAAGLSDGLNARAFTIGSDIAFGAGEYQPGTMIGDALIAHELAHVVQQGGANGASSPQSKGAGGYESLEDDADAAAVGAVVSTWGGVKGALTDIGRSAMPRMRSGLRLQSCGPDPTPKTPYEKLVVEATQKLQEPRFGFGFPWFLVGEDCDSTANLKEQKFDTRHWKTTTAGPKECMLVNLGNPSDAINALFDEKNRKKWEIDCRIFSELPHWYAMLHTLGAKKFDQKFPKIELRRINLTGLQTRGYWFEAVSQSHQLIEAQVRQDTGQGPVTETVREHQQPVAKAEAKARPEDDVLAEVPVGSRVTFGTYPVAPGWPVHKDNTVKMGANLYATHDVPEGKDSMYTKEQMVEACSEKYHGLPKENVCIVAVETYDVEKMTAAP